eukprot:UC4_evm3s969
MADSVKYRVRAANRRVWEEKVIVEVSGGSHVFLDDDAAECLRWSSSASVLLAAGAATVARLPSSNEGKSLTSIYHVRKAVFVITSSLHFAEASIQDVLGPTCEECVIFCAMTEADHLVFRTAKERSQQQSATTSPAVYLNFAQKCKSWIDNQKCKPKVRISHVDLCVVAPFSDFYILPCLSERYPLLGHRAGENSTRDYARHAGIQISQALSSMGLSVASAYSMGSTAKLVSEKLVAIQENQKKSFNDASVIIFERGCDLAEPLGHNDSLGSRIFELLPKAGLADVQIDLSHLCSSGTKTCFPGSIAHPASELATNILGDVITLPRKEALLKLQRVLLNSLRNSGIEVDANSVSGKVTMEKLEILVCQLEAPEILHEHLPLIQICRGIIQAFKHRKEKLWDSFAAIEKILGLIATEQGDDKLLDELLDYLPASIFDDNMGNENSNELMRRDALILLMFCFALAGNNPGISEPELERLKDVVKTEEIDLLRYLSSNSIGLSQFSRLAQGHHGPRPLMRQLLDTILDSNRPELIDLVSHTGEGGLKGLVQSGLGMLGGFMGVTQKASHPCDNPVIVLCCLGGVTCNEIRHVRDAMETKSCDKVLLISTEILSPKTIMSSVCSRLSVVNRNLVIFNSHEHLKNEGVVEYDVIGRVGFEIAEGLTVLCDLSDLSFESSHVCFIIPWFDIKEHRGLCCEVFTLRLGFRNTLGICLGGLFGHDAFGLSVSLIIGIELQVAKFLVKRRFVTIGTKLRELTRSSSSKSSPPSSSAAGAAFDELERPSFSSRACTLFSTSSNSALSLLAMPARRSFSFSSSAILACCKLCDFEPFHGEG